MLENVISDGLTLAGAGGIITLIGLFIRKTISSVSQQTIRNEAEVDILNMWKYERDVLKALTETLQKERLELTVKLSAVQAQLTEVQKQLSVLIEEKNTLTAALNSKCETCVYKPKGK